MLVDPQTSKAFYYKQLVTRQCFEVQQLLTYKSSNETTKDKMLSFILDTVLKESVVYITILTFKEEDNEGKKT